MSRSKQKGTAAESAVARYLAETFPHVERRALRGSSDRGDIAGIPGVVVEVKAAARTELAAWVDEATAEAVNDGAEIGVVFHKRRGKGHPEQWYVTMTGDSFVRLLRAWKGARW